MWALRIYRGKMSLKDRLLKNSTLSAIATLEESILFKRKNEVVPTSIPMINAALSGDPINGGITPGVTMLAGESKRFKSGFALFLASCYLKHHPDAVLLFYDSEFGSPKSYFDTFEIPVDRVIHAPVTDIEQLKSDVVKQLNDLKEEDRLFIIVDSIGNLASKKEVEDALNDKSVADMTRAKSLKSFFRMITPHLVMKRVPFIPINHVYKEIGMFPKDIVGGGTGSYLASENIWIIGRQQEKKTEVIGYNFIIKIEKAREVQEGLKIPITVLFKGGIDKWSGLLEEALESGLLIKDGRGYKKVNKITGEISEEKYQEKDLNGQFWKKMLKEDLGDYIKKKFTLAQDRILQEEDEVNETVAS